MDDLAFLTDLDAVAAARRLLGCELERTYSDGSTARLRIVETEAYDQADAASHSYRGRTPRTDVMFGPAGHLYVYFTYGMHYCCNVVVGPEDVGAAVLIRAVEPLKGEASLAASRPGGHSGVDLTNGPAKLCQALGIGKTMNGHDLRNRPLRLVPSRPCPSSQVVTTTRVGITKSRDALRRFYIKDNPYVSKA